MDVFTPEQLARLVDASGDALVSIYLPTARAGRETRQGPIRLKNLVAEAEERLATRGADQGVLDRVRSRIDDCGFWQHQSDGLAILTGAGRHVELRLPAAFEELVVVGERFHVKPLLANLDRGRRYFVLALSENDVRLVEATRSTAAEVERDDVPESLAAALWYEDPEPALQYHATARGGAQTSYHGHGLGEDDTADRRRRFLRAVDDGVTTLLAGSRAPLVLAGAERTQAAYREVSRYEGLAGEGIDGNPEHLSVDELHARSWPIVAARFAAATAEAAARYQALAGTGRAGDDPAEVALAAHDGRVETLLVSPHVAAWGRFDAAERLAEQHDSRQPGDRDLADAAAAATFRTGGRVLVVDDPADVPSRTALAAIYRY